MPVTDDFIAGRPGGGTGGERQIRQTAEGLQQSQPGNQETEEAVRRNEQLYGI